MKNKGFIINYQKQLYRVTSQSRESTSPGLPLPCLDMTDTLSPLAAVYLPHWSPEDAAVSDDTLSWLTVQSAAPGPFALSVRAI